MWLKRALIYLWASPTTLVGLLFLALAALSGGRVHIVDGVIEIHGGLVRLFLRHCTFLRGGASAMTLGHVVLGQDAQTLDWTRPHERVHVRQCEHWGPLFIVAYLCGSIIALLRGGQAYHDNPFEKAAHRS